MYQNHQIHYNYITRFANSPELQQSPNSLHSPETPQQQKQQELPDSSNLSYSPESLGKFILGKLRMNAKF